MKPDLVFLETLARQAGEILRAGQANGYRVSYKSLLDVVTEVDHRSEEFLIGEVLRNFPDHRIIAEESGGLDGDGSCDCMWHIDTLDGTVNFAHGIPLSLSRTLSWWPDSSSR